MYVRNRNPSESDSILTESLRFTHELTFRSLWRRGPWWIVIVAFCNTYDEGQGKGVWLSICWPARSLNPYRAVWSLIRQDRSTFIGATAANAVSCIAYTNKFVRRVCLRGPFSHDIFIFSNMKWAVSLWEESPGVMSQNLTPNQHFVPFFQWLRVAGCGAAVVKMLNQQLECQACILARSTPAHVANLNLPTFTAGANPSFSSIPIENACPKRSK